MGVIDRRKFLMRWMQWTPALLALTMSGEAMAVAIGLPENTARIGYAAGFSRLAVDDPAGSTEAKWSVQPLTLIYTDWLSGGLRYWAEVYYHTASLDAGPGSVGQDVSRLGGRFSVQRSVNVGGWSPWLGAGVAVSRDSYSARHTEDEDGFLLSAYPDRDETGFGVVLQAVNEWELSRQWDLSAKLEQLIPVSGGVSETALSFGVLYRY